MAEEHTQLLTPEQAPDLDALEPAPEDPYAVHPGDEPVPDPSAHEEGFHSDPPAEAGAGTLEPSAVEPGPPAASRHPAPGRRPAPRAGRPRSLPPRGAPAGARLRSRGRSPVAPAYETPTAPPDAPLEPAPVDDPPVGDPARRAPDVDEPPPRQSPEPADEHEVGEIEGPADDVLEDTPEFLQGHARARPAVVRAEASARLRLRGVDCGERIGGRRRSR